MGESKMRGRTRSVAVALTDVGRQRRHNEDNILVRQDLGLFAVADGMGGHNAGNVASALATKSLHNFFEATQFGDLPGPVPLDELDLQPEARRVVSAIRKANHDVYLISNTYAQHQGMGSTVVAAYVSSDTDQIHIGHVGDSRCYLIRDGKIEQLTKDHSLINDALEIKPDLTPDELARLPKNIITRALGMKDIVKVDVRSEALKPGDLFLLCSDGLTGMVTEAQILQVLEVTDDPQDACELLIDMANEAGGTDNISALIIRIEDNLEPEVAASERRSGTTRPHIIDEFDSILPPDHLSLPAELDDKKPDAIAEELDLSLALPTLDEVPADDNKPADQPPADRPSQPNLTPIVFADRRARAVAGSGRYVSVSPTNRGTQPSRRRSGEIRIARCVHCHHELFIGNRFCVECGAPIKL